ncbi:hypothetical protein [Chengkuizengella axinellae]|uniref:Protein-export membrane protein SecG n=1 Tax=Chengkuizengella axinellae TaxID=3064388 RepID=A0ABT9J609_9BACL|nr:hypothetical protein [Chengkuizengella sp. 2205SS18-9]MDP5276389.1 hypothetical protein [Chengkuizengella sp. 2205SS18-9]
MLWNMVLVVIVLLVGVIGTIMIGQSKSNKEGNPSYFQQTGKKWARLSAFYVIGIIVFAIVFIIFFNR